MKFDSVSPRVPPLPGNHIDTDQIIPARFLRTVSREGLADCLFTGWKKSPDFPLINPRCFGRSLLRASQKFGCSSSREHAPWMLLAGGYRVVITASCVDCFWNNALRNGLLPMGLSSGDSIYLADRLQADDSLAVLVDLTTQTFTLAKRVMKFEVDAFSRGYLLQGVDRIQYLLAELPAIEAFEGRSCAQK
ncbi:MAG: 3-isopropylmalate dehydratase small subunit [Myxococcales bacterium]|nr:3-isopropylmalate dehydratase small subunit [Myxococcales bacterium]